MMDKEKDVIVLMSTYNGEKYMREQIHSLLNQRGINLKILIRDDGSTDGTVGMIRELKSEKISFYQGNNVGPARSFMDLVMQAPRASFYAYCDQDDIWDEEKLMTAIRAIKKDGSDKPHLYMSTYDVVDEELNFLYKRDMKFGIPFTLESTIVERAPSACTMVFDYGLMQLLKMGRPEYIRMHDYWTLMVAEAFKCRIVGENKSLIKYRLHSSNSVGLKKGVFVRVNRLVSSALYGNNERQRQVISLYKLYKDILPEDSCKVIEQVVFYRMSIKNRMKLAANRRFRTDELQTNLLFFASVLMGLF